ncbi:MAG: hypothetical protein ACYDDS_21435 [Candidatus Sulfotelmatobacter sp.]
MAEGMPRWRINKQKQRELEAELNQKSVAQLRQDGRRDRERMVENEIGAGVLKEDQRESRLREIEEAEIPVTREWLRRCIADEAREEHRFRGEVEVINALLDPKTTPERVRNICKEAFMIRSFEVEPGVMKEVEVPAWPIPPGSPFPGYLSQYAEQYVEALRDPRFPRCDVSTRPSSQLKQFWFLSRALAGALFGVTTRTAINLVGSLRPEQAFEESRRAKPARKQRRLITKK